jgi:hypothetical protein
MAFCPGGALAVVSDSDTRKDFCDVLGAGSASASVSLIVPWREALGVHVRTPVSVNTASHAAIIYIVECAQSRIARISLLLQRLLIDELAWW